MPEAVQQSVCGGEKYKLLDSALVGLHLTGWGSEDLDPDYQRLLTQASLIVLLKAMYLR